MARHAGQYSVAKECSVAQGKYLAMFTDNVKQSGDDLTINVSTDNEPQTPEERRQEIADKNVG